MTEASFANLEMAIVLPLGVVANQLMRIEADLRLLNMKALDLAKERASSRHTGLVEARLESINETLDAIRGLVSDIEADIQPRSRSVTAASTRQHTSHTEHPPVEDAPSSPRMVQPVFSNRKPQADQDD